MFVTQKFVEYFSHVTTTAGLQEFPRAGFRGVGIRPWECASAFTRKARRHHLPQELTRIKFSTRDMYVHTKLPAGELGFSEPHISTAASPVPIRPRVGFSPHGSFKKKGVANRGAFRH